MIPQQQNKIDEFDRNANMNTSLGNEAGRVYVQKISEAADAIRNKIQSIPDTLVILGSGLGGLARAVQASTVIPYADIPHMPQTSTEGHAGELIVGKLGEQEISVFSGRVHCHDGLRPSEVVFGARVMASLGIENLIVTNAAGSLNSKMKVGDFVVLENHISLFLPEDPSYGLEHPQLGDKFYPQTDPYDAELGELFLQIADELGYEEKCHKGTYCFVSGPRYESRGDVDFLRRLQGVDTVGMSTVPEVLALTQQSRGAIRILGISTITNQAAGLSETEPNHEEVKEAGNSSAPQLQEIISELIKRQK